MEQLEKDPCNFSKEKKELLKFEQKSIEIDAFHKLEEEKIKKKLKKEVNKDLNWLKKKQGAKSKKKKEQEKTEEEQFWDKLTTLNKEIRVIGNIK